MILLLENVQERGVSSLMMLLVLTRRWDTVLKVLVLHSSCLSLTTSSSLRALFCYLNRFVDFYLSTE